MGWRSASSIYCTGGWGGAGGAGGGGGGGGSVAGDAKEREEKEQRRGESERGKHSPDGRRKAANEEAALGAPRGELVNHQQEGEIIASDDPGRTV